MHSLHVAVHLVQDLPAVASKLFLHSDRQVSAALLEQRDTGVIGVPASFHS